jgi:hypothetical protein
MQVLRPVRFHAIAAIAAVVATAFTASPASAFCRTTTSSVPAGYDPTQNGCWTQGTPLAWRTSEVTYSIGVAASQQVSLADVTRVADLAFAAWNQVSCPDGAPTVYAHDNGVTSWVPDGGKCSMSSDCHPATDDAILFDDEVWPYNDPSSTLALTTVTYGVDDGAIFQAYIEINTTPPHQVTVEEPPPEGSTAYDLQSILTHETGHFFGLAHAVDSTAVMYAFYAPGRTQLQSDDVAGFCAIYPPLTNPLVVHPASSPVPGGCATASTGSTPGGATGPLLVALALVAARNRRARRRARLRCAPSGSAGGR